MTIDAGAPDGPAAGRAVGIIIGMLRRILGSRRGRVWCFIFFIVAIQLSNAWWISRDAVRGGYGTDAANHYQALVRVGEGLRTVLSGDPFGGVREIFGAYRLGSDVYGPLVHIVVAPWCRLTGTSPDAAAGINAAIFLTLMVVGTYRVGSLIYSKTAGIIAAVMVPFVPLVFSETKEYKLEIPLAGIMVAAVYFLCRSRRFESRRYSWYLAAAVFFGNLVKASFGVYFFPVYAYAVWTAVQQRAVGQGRNRVWRHSGYSLVLYAVSGSWYAAQFARSHEALYYFHTRWDFYLRQYSEVLGYGLGVLTLVAFVVTSAVDRRRRWIWWYWIGIPLVLLHMDIVHRSPRYLIPLIIPAVLTVGGFSVRWCRSVRFRPFVIGALAVSMLQNLQVCAARIVPQAATGSPGQAMRDIPQYVPVFLFSNAGTVRYPVRPIRSAAGAEPVRMNFYTILSGAGAELFVDLTDPQLQELIVHAKQLVRTVPWTIYQVMRRPAHYEQFRGAEQARTDEKISRFVDAVLSELEVVRIYQCPGADRDGAVAEMWLLRPRPLSGMLRRE